MVHQAQGPLRDLALHTLGWKAFQDLCAEICAEVLRVPVSIYREAQDGGQDAVFLGRGKEGGEECTVQCKFSATPGKRLQVSDMSGELRKARHLAASGKAHSYFLITNMGVDAPVAGELRSKLTAHGVRYPEVFGGEWVTLQICTSPRLRALVPRVYGLGDLSTILDERKAAQTRSLLGHLTPHLRVYVPTAAHRDAVRVLNETGLVLLLGAPACGKSMLAAILATAALDSDSDECFQVDSPSQLMDVWNPNSSGRLYWIDDAFGANQLRNDHVEQWIAMMGKVKTAIAGGNRFILTSRRHIWNAAKEKLGTRSHHALSSGRAVVDVGSLSPEEREQILYNHVKAGNQSRGWRTAVKPAMEELAKSPSLLPEIARRLGDSSFTTNVALTRESLLRFIERPMGFLVETILELSDSQRAALTLIFLNRGFIDRDARDEQQIARVVSRLGVSEREVQDAFFQLEGSFVVQKEEPRRGWAFSHPTIADALSSILSKRPDLVELYLRGAKLDAILSETVCDGVAPVEDAVVLPSSAWPLLVDRITEVPNELGLNSHLFEYLASRAAPDVLSKVVNNPSLGLLHRESTPRWRASLDPRLRFLGACQRLGLLPGDIRRAAANQLTEAALNRHDGSFLSNDLLLGLIPPAELLKLSLQLATKAKDELPGVIEDIEANADVREDEDSDDFEDIRSFVSALEDIFQEYSPLAAVVYELHEVMDEAAERLRQRRRDREEDESDVGDDVPPSRISSRASGRSIFSDLDT